MSFRRGGNPYGQQYPPQPPNPAYNDPYNQQQQPGQAQGQNGGQQPQQQYPGQHTYGQYEGGAPAQHVPQGIYSQGSVHSPRQASFGAQAQYPGQQQYQYNPQHFAPPQQQQYQQPQAPLQQYNPGNFVSTSQAPFSPTYNPAAYSSTPASPYADSPTRYMSATSGPVDSYAYQSDSYSAQHQQYAQSPLQQTYSPAQQYSPAPPSQSYSQSSQHSSPQPNQYGAQMPPPPPPPTSQAQDATYPSSDYRYGSISSTTSTQRQQTGGASPGPPAEEWRPSPPLYQYNDPRQSPSPLYHSNTHSSIPSPPAVAQGPPPPAHGAPGRSNTNRHPQSRPLPGPPEPDFEPDYFQNRDNERVHMTHEEEEAISQEDLFQEVEDTLYSVGRPPGGHSPSISVSQPPHDAAGPSTTLFAPSSPGVQRNGSIVNGHLSPAPPEPQEHFSDSDAEATQGLAMMAMDEEEDRWRQSGVYQGRLSGSFGSPNTSHQQPLMPQPEQSDSDDYGTVDMSTFGGGWTPGHLSYGGHPSVLAAGGDLNGRDSYSQPVSSQHSSMRRSHASQSSQASRGDYDYAGEVGSYRFRPFNSAARVDAGGTGGLSEPTADGRRQSFDEGDEYAFMDGTVPDRFPDEPPDIFYQPASTSYNRPLPPPPFENENLPYLQTDFKGPPTSPPPYPIDPGSYPTIAQQAQNAQRSTSLMSHTSTPLVQQPLRSKTDAEERRLKQLQAKGQGYTPSEASVPITPAIDLPSLPGKRFIPAQLGAPAFKKCEEPWSLMSLLKWLLQVTTPEQFTELKEAEVKEALVALFTNKVPTMNIADAENLSNQVVQNMYDAGTLVTTEEWVKIVPGPMSGVIFQLTGSGCYSPTLHDHVVPGRCYAHHCQRTLKKVNLLTQPQQRGSEDWAEFYHLKKEDVEGKDKKEIERQAVLHEIVYTEDFFMEQLRVLQSVYRDMLAKSEPSIITPKRREKFLNDVFGKVDAIRQANEEHLLPQLKYRQQEQGPWIVGFSDIFRQWIRKAKQAYIDYAGSFPGATWTVRQEIDRNVEFRNFIERARNDKRSLKLGWDTYLKAPITRLQRYTLLLSTVLKNMKGESEEKANLKIAYDEVKVATLECDARVAEMQRKVDLTDLGLKLVLRAGMQNAVKLNLDHFGREVVHRGDLQRMGGNRFTWLDSHAILFDHYLVLAKTWAQKTEENGKFEKYDVSRLPIPMDLLILESSNDPAVQKSTYMRGISSVRDVTARTGTPGSDPSGLSRTQTNQSPGPNPLQHTNTSSSGVSLQTVTSLQEGKDADRILYPFKVKHLGRETYTLFAPTEQVRREWCVKITEAKTKHAAALYNQNAEPFKLRVMADSAFVFDAFAGSGSKSVTIQGTPIDRAIKEVEAKYKEAGRPGPICRARVNCATSFTTPASGRQMVAVGTDFGVYLSDMDNPRGWNKSIPMSRVTQVAVLEEFNLFLLISDKSLIAYHLDVVWPNSTNGPAATNDSTAKAPKKLSGSKDVGFFVTGRMKERTLVFYKKRENLASVFKVLEPIYQKSSEKKTRGMFKRGNTEFFRDYDEFYIPAECGGMNLFHSSLAVGTARGFEVLTLDKKQSASVPDLKQPHVQNIATHIKDQKALSMLRLSDQEFLLVYANCAVYCNKHGEVSRSVIMEFVGNAQSSAMYGAYLILFDNDFVEIRNAQNGRLKQIIAGREIKCLDDGGSWSAVGPNAGSSSVNTATNGPQIGGRTVKFVMQHPELEKTQIVVELLLNEKMKDER